MLTNNIISPFGTCYGGGISIDWGSSPTFINCDIIGNSNLCGNSHGGGLFSMGPSTSIINCTVADNIVTDNYGGGIEHYFGLISIVNSIFWDNTAGPTYGEINASSYGAVTVEYSDIQGGWEGEGNIDADPLFVDEENGDYHIQAGSPCIDAGTSEGAPEDDIDGDLRDSYPDIGSDEYTE